MLLKFSFIVKLQMKGQLYEDAHQPQKLFICHGFEVAL